MLLLRLLNPLTTILKYLHWFKFNERIEYKLSHKVLTTAQPSYLRNLNSLQPPRSTRSSSVVTLSRPPTISLKITDRSFSYASPRLWNQLPDSFRQPHHIPVSIHLIHFSTHLCHHPHVSSSITLSLQAQNLPFQPYISFTYTGLPHDNGTGPDLSLSSFYF